MIYFNSIVMGRKGKTRCTIEARWLGTQLYLYNTQGTGRWIVCYARMRYIPSFAECVHSLVQPCNEDSLRVSWMSLAMELNEPKQISNTGPKKVKQVKQHCISLVCFTIHNILPYDQSNEIFRKW